MSGTKAGGQKTKAANLRRNPNHYQDIGAIGGRKNSDDGVIKGFAAMTLAKRREASRKGLETRWRRKQEKTS